MAIKCPTNSVVFWSGAHAAIPANWSRDTNFDAKYIQGGEHGFTSDADGGNASRTFTANAHLHIGNVHWHLFGGASATGGGNSSKSQPESGRSGAGTTHSHGTIAGNSTAITYQNTIISINADTTALPYIKLIVIRPDDTNQDIPIGAVCYTDETSLPTGFEKCDAGSGRPDMNGRYILGADGGGGDGGGTGGSTTYTLTATNHTNAVDGHIHASELCGGPPIPRDVESPGDRTTEVARYRHHYVTMSSKVLSDLSTDAVTFNATTIDPAYVELLGIQNTSAGATTPLNVIIGYVGSEVSIPTGWELINATIDRQIRSTITDGSIGDTGGSDSHTPTTQAHGHTHSGGHNHNTTVSSSGTWQTSTHTYNILHGDLSGIGKHTHTWTIGMSTPFLQNATVTIQAADARLSYRTMIFIKRVPLPTVRFLGGSILGGKIAA